MANFNKVMLMGNLTRDPELSYLPSQTAVCRFGLATNRRWTSQDGQPKEEVTFVDVDAFGKTAETIAKYLKKGRPVFIEGRLQYRQWEAQDGTKRSKLSVVVDNFQFIDSRPAGTATADSGEAADAGAGGGYAPRPPQQARPVYRPAGRPAAQPVGAPPAPAAAPVANMDADPPSPAEEEAPPIKEDDIPF